MGFGLAHIWKVIIHSMVPVTTNQHLSSHIIPYHPIFIYWLVVLTIFKHLSQWEGLSHILWKIKFMLETTNQYIIGNISHYMSSHYVPIPIINGRLIISYPHHICQKKISARGWRMERRGHSFARSRRDVKAEWGHAHCRRLHNLRVGGLSLNISSWLYIYIPLNSLVHSP